MEHFLFEVQLCIKISIFKEKHVFDILIILCLMTSLHQRRMLLQGPYRLNEPMQTPGQAGRRDLTGGRLAGRVGGYRY